MSAEPTVPFTIEQLWTYPIKSCGGVRLQSAELLETGLEWDRAWMVVDESGEFVSQRELPRMALISTRFRMGQLEVKAPGMLSLHLALDSAEAPMKVRVWDDEVEAYDMGSIAAQWFSDFLGPDAPESMSRLRLVRFDPEARRLSAPQWTGGVEATTQFSDGFALLALSSASLADFNQRLQVLGHAPVGVERFRPNLVLGGIEAHDEDRFDTLTLKAHLRDAPDQEHNPAEAPAVQIKLVKPCSRCSIPDIDPASAASQPEISRLLQTYRQDRRLMGAITFGMNGIVLGGAGQMLHEGMAGEARWGAW